MLVSPLSFHLGVHLCVPQLVRKLGLVCLPLGTLIPASSSFQVYKMGTFIVSTLHQLVKLIRFPLQIVACSGFFVADKDNRVGETFFPELWIRVPPLGLEGRYVVQLLWFFSQSPSLEKSRPQRHLQRRSGTNSPKKKKTTLTSVIIYLRRLHDECALEIDFFNVL